MRVSGPIQFIAALSQALCGSVLVSIFGGPWWAIVATGWLSFLIVVWSFDDSKRFVR